MNLINSISLLILSIAVASAAGETSATDDQAAATLFEQGERAHRQAPYEAAFSSTLQAAQGGDKVAQHKLGAMYLNGLGVTKDEEKGLFWVHAAADQGYADAQYSLGRIYLLGRGGRKDYAKARIRLMAAAEQGHVKAKNNLGYLYFHGLGVNKDYRKAYKWFFEAAQRGNSEAQYSLAVMYRQGLGVKRDWSTAMEWLRKAAKGGLRQANNILAWSYATSFDANLRDGKQAMELATELVDLERTPQHLDTLAAAHAETGDFAGAVRLQREAIEKLEKENNVIRLRKAKKRLNYYEHGKAWRE